VENGAHIINVSGGQYDPAGQAHPLLASAVTQCERRGVLIVAAAGNDGCECLHVPAALPGVLAVGAMDEHGQPLETSNWGVPYRTGGLLVPGANLVGARAGGGISVVSGTSFATAIASGVAGLLLSRGLQHGRQLAGSQIRRILLDSALKCLDHSILCRRSLAGGLNLSRARTVLRAADLPMSQESASDLPAGNAPGESLATEFWPSQGEAKATGQALGFSVPAGRAPAVEQAIVASEGCTCAACQAKANGRAGLVFALGQVGYDLVSEARRDSIAQHMDGTNPNPHEAAHILGYLKDRPWEATSIHWTLNVDQTPFYVVTPSGPFAPKGYELLHEFLAEQVAGQVEMVSVAGRLAGQARLMNGQMVPVVVPELRGTYSWATAALLKAVVGNPPAASAPAETKRSYERKTEGVRGFLQKVYYELRNLGLAAEDRALNYAATNALLAGRVYESAINESMELESVDVERSPVCRLGSDCWDVKLIFFYPERQVQTLRKVYRLTVDVSDIVPVAVGPVRSWFMR
jgi:cyanobactin maturation PatA/PatG family protease